MKVAHDQVRNKCYSPASVQPRYRRNVTKLYVLLILHTAVLGVKLLGKDLTKSAGNCLYFIPVQT